MKVLKGMALGLAGFFLFLSLFFLGLIFTLNSTILNPQFMVDEVEKLDLATAVREILTDQVLLDDAYIAAINETLLDLKPWINQQISDAIYTVYDYLSGESEDISFTVPMETLKLKLVDNLAQAYLRSPPPEYARLPASEKERYLANIRQQTLDTVPAKIEVNEINLGADIFQALRQAREIINYIRTGYFALIGSVVVLIVLVVFILREAKSISRSLGIIFILAGAISVAAFLILKSAIVGMTLSYDIMPEFQAWMPVVINDVLSPWGVFGFSFLACGIILLAISFFVPGNQPAYDDEPTSENTL